MKLLLISVLLASSSLGGAADSEKKPPPAFIQDIVAIRIPKIEAEDAGLYELISFVAQKVVELDLRKPGGISFLTVGFEAPDGDDKEILDPPTETKKIRYSVEDARVDKVFTDLAVHFDVEFHVTSIGVVVTPAAGNPFPNAKAEKGTVYYTYRKTMWWQSATAPESKAKGTSKPKPESEVRSQ